MRRVALTAAAALAILLSSCTALSIGTYGAALWINHVFSLAPVYGSDMEGVSATSGTGIVTVRLARVPGEGKFLRLLLPADQTFTGESWSGDSETLHLVVPTSDGIDIGVVQRPSYNGAPVELKLAIGSAYKQASTPPNGPQNAVRDFKVVELGDGRVRLEWTEINIGDYDLNGEVNVADLTPLGKYFGAEYGDPNWDLASVADGDENKAISISDLTPIGQNYGATVAGYMVERNGESIENPQSGLPTVLRQPSPGISQRPLYSMELSGSVFDTWSVAPVDSQDQAGSVAAPAIVDRMDLSVNLNISGIDLRKLEGFGSGPYGPGCSLLRVIDDGDFPYRTHPSSGKGIMTAGGPNETLFNEVPRGRPLLLDIHYAPVVDLATSAPKSTSGARRVSAIAEEDQEITSVVFTLPPGEEQMQMDVDINLQPVNPGLPSLGYYVFLTYTTTTIGNTESISLRLDYLNQLVSKDHGSGFDIAAKLLDHDHDCISDARMEQLEDYTTYAGGAKTDVKWQGTKRTLAEYGGLLACDGASQGVIWQWDLFAPSGPAYAMTPENNREVHFTELTSFSDENGSMAVDAAPDSFLDGNLVRVVGYFWTEGIRPAKYWADSITRNPAY